VRKGDNKIYITYPIGGIMVKRVWCETCGDDDAIVEKECPTVFFSRPAPTPKSCK